jgi:hypothetical protein
MKNYIFFFVILFAISFLTAQNKQLVYGVDVLPQSLMQNPGSSLTFDKHIGIPFLSQLHFNFGSTDINAFDIFEDSQVVSINQRILNVLNRISTNDFVEVNQQFEILSFGWRNRKDIYFSGGLYQEVDVISYIPKNFALLGYQGNAGDNIGKIFSFNEIKAQGEALAVWHFGVNKKVTNKLRLGGRFKIYSSLVDFRSTDNKGTFVTKETPNGPNFYTHSLVNANVKVQTSGISELNDLPEGSMPGDVSSILAGRYFFAGNLGLGVDLGFTYDINYAWSLSASVLDLGFISHTKNVETYRASGSYDLDGIELEFPENNNDPAPPYYQQLSDAIEAAVPIDTLTTSYTTLRPVKLNAELSYGFSNTYKACNCYATGDDLYDNNVGLQLYAVKRPRAFSSAATLFYDKRITNKLRGKLTYTVDAFSFTNIGALVAVTGKSFNFYVAADNLLSYINLAKANALSLQLGFQFIINKD